MLIVVVFVSLLTYFVDVESIYFLLIEIVKQYGECDECKNLFLSVCDILFESTMSTHLKARVYSFLSSLTISLSLLLNSMPSFKACRVALLQKIIKFAHESSHYPLILSIYRITRVFLQLLNGTAE